MRPLLRPLLLLVALGAFHGVQACSAETDPGAELNPQPLPPEDGENDKVATPEGAQDPGSYNGGGSSSSGSSGAPSTGADGDAGADGGDE